MKNIKRVLCAVLCLCMITGTLLALASCDNGKEPVETEPVVSVVKVVKDIEEGTKITADMIKTEKIAVSNVHINAIRDAAKVEGKYAAQKMYAGEYVFGSKLTDVSLGGEASASNVVVTEHIELGGDVATDLQKLINDNPGRTIDFPDGEYVISKPITIPADPAKAVSLRLSDFAVIKAADSWSAEGAMIQMAVGTIPAESERNSFNLTGGTIDANGVAKAISIDNASDILVSNVGIVNSLVGVEIKAGAADIENITITGNGADKSVGVIFGGNDCTAANIRISNVVNGVKVTGDNNALKSVFAVCAENSKDTCGFYDTGAGSRYDMCQSEHFSTAFRMGENTNAIYYGCYIKWNNADNEQHWAFVADKKFNSLIRNCDVDFDFADCDGSFLVVGESGGEGQIIYPMIGGKDNMKNVSFKSYLVDYDTTDEDDSPVVYK